MTMASLRLLRPARFPLIDWRRNMRPILLVAVPALVILAALTFWLQGGRYASTENAYVKADIAQIASEVQGRIAEVTMRDHAEVAPGEMLVQPRSGAFRVALAKAEAELDSARTAVAHAEGHLRESKAERKEAESKVAYLEMQAERQHDLAERGRGPATQVRGGRQQGVAAARSGHRGAREDCARGGRARRQSRAAD